MRRIGGWTGLAGPGEPVSAALVLTDTASVTGKAVQEAVAAIDQVHGDGNLPRCAVFTDVFSEAGNFDRQGMEIRISRSAAYPRITMLHEMGHFIDHGWLGVTRGGRRVSDTVWDAWVDAVGNSVAVQEIADMLAAGRALSSGHPVKSSFLEYLLRPSELWARSYSQFVAQRSGNSAILSELSEFQELELPFQWQENDFRAIDLAIERVLRAVGWIQ